MPKLNLSTLKALNILEVLAASDEDMRLSDVARELDYPVSTTHRLLLGLMERAYVQRDQNTGRYFLGTKILTLQAQVVRHRHLGQLALPHLVQLKQQCNATVNLGMLNDNCVVYLESLIPDSSFAYYLRPGTRMPLHCTAMGKVFLAYMPLALRNDLLTSLDFQKHTPHTITSADDMKTELRSISQQGYAVDNEEFTLGVRCTAAPIYDHNGCVVAAASVTSLAARLPPERIVNQAELVTQVCQTISAALGYQRPKIAKS
jgi:IclR family transcriptional regulator, KDG regulon repressor